MTATVPLRDGSIPAPGARWRGFVFFLPLLLWVLAGAGLIGIAAACSKHFREKGYGRWVRIWGRVPLIFCGIKLEIHGAQHVQGKGAKLVLFNHVSQLDLFVLASLCPDGAVVMYKKEFESMPGLGSAMRNLGMIPVDRSDLVSAIASVSTAGKRILEEDAPCFIAPEGTRSRVGGLQSFKKGAFHLAAEHGIPVVPMVLRGIGELLPMGGYFPRSGVIRVDYLDPIDTSEWDSNRVRKHVKEVRDLFLEYVPAAPKKVRPPKVEEA